MILKVNVVFAEKTGRRFWLEVERQLEHGKNEEQRNSGEHYCKAAEELCGQNLKESRSKQTASV